MYDKYAFYMSYGIVTCIMVCMVGFILMNFTRCNAYTYT